MDIISVLPVEIWNYIFGYLDMASLVSVCGVCVDFRCIALSCYYPNLRQIVSSNTQYFFRCGSYEIVDNLNMDGWTKRMFHWSGLEWNDECDAIWNVKNNLIKVFSGKCVQFKDSLVDYDIISGCKEVIFKYPGIKYIPDAFNGIENVTIKYHKMTYRDVPWVLDEDYEEYEASLGSIDVTNLSKSKRVAIINGWEFINVNTLTSFSDCVEELNLTRTRINSNEIIKSFSKMKYVNLSGNFEINDFSCLCNVEELVLAETAIQDVTGFEKVKKLNLDGCEIIDFEPIRNAEYLSLCGSNIEDVSIFNKVKVLRLDGCKRLIGLESLTDVEIIRVGDCVSCENDWHTE